MRKAVFAFVVLAVTVAVSHSAEEKLNKSLIIELMSQLPKNAITQLQSTLKNELERQNLSPACLIKVLKLTTTELAQAFPSKFSSCYVCVKVLRLACSGEMKMLGTFCGAIKNSKQYHFLISNISHRSSPCLRAARFCKRSQLPDWKVCFLRAKMFFTSNLRAWKTTLPAPPHM